MKRKLGPLQLWQWALIGAIVGMGTVLYRRGHPTAAQNALAAVTPSSAQYNPIDPTTGLPVSGGVSTSTPASGIDVDELGRAIGAALPQQQPTDLATTLSNFGQLETLLAGLTEIGGGGGAAPDSAGAAVNTDHEAVKAHTGTKKAKKPATKKKAAKPKKTTRAGHTNPGHHVTNHGGGKKTAGASAPHNARQHHNVQPPAHQRHEPTKHPSAQHPAAATPTHGPTPLPPREPPRRSPAAVRTPLPRRPAPKKAKRR